MSDEDVTITYGPRGNKVSEEWVSGSRWGNIEPPCHHVKQGNPSDTHYFANGRPKHIRYRVYWQKHRIGGPAELKYWQDGTKKLETYFYFGKRHNVHGPAEIEYDDDGRITKERYILVGEEREFDEWLYLVLSSNELTPEEKIEFKLTYM